MLSAQTIEIKVLPFPFMTECRGAGAPDAPAGGGQAFRGGSEAGQAGAGGLGASVWGCAKAWVPGPVHTAW